MKGSFIRKAVTPTRMGLDGLPVWERGAEKRDIKLYFTLLYFTLSTLST